jgi:hypothetical protein
MGRAPLESVQDFTKHCVQDARRDGRQHWIAEFVIHRKMQLSVILIPRFKAPDGY